MEDFAPPHSTDRVPMGENGQSIGIGGQPVGLDGQLTKMGRPWVWEGVVGHWAGHGESTPMGGHAFATYQPATSPLPQPH